MSSSDFTIIVRSSNQKHADENVLFDPEMTFGDLKQKLEQDHPGKPEYRKQRLIHGGKILADKQQIKSVLGETNAIVHLVFGAETTPKNAQNDPEPVTATGLRQRHNIPMTEPVMTAPHMYGAAPFAYDTEAYAQWWAQYQEHYAYMMRYYTSTYGMPAATDVGTAQENVAANQPVPNNGQEQEVRQNVGGGIMEVADDDDGRDWLDALFALTRFGLLLSVIYFYSSTYRFIATLVVLLLIYMYQAGVFQVNRIPGRAPERNAEPQEPETDDNNNRSDDEIQEPTQNSPAAPGVFATAWCFVRSFFSSLVPTGPPGVVN